MLYKRGRAAKARAAAIEEETGADPAGLSAGYYRVFDGERWRVVHWSPAKNRWDVGGGMTWGARHWIEIGEKVV